MKTKRVALYARVSTDHQTSKNQLRELRAVAERLGWVVVEEYVDHGLSGAKDRDQRPAFDRMLKAAVRREFDVLAAWSVDRLGRSLQQLVRFLEEIHSKRIDLYLHQQGIDTASPAGKALFQMCGVFAEFERSMIQERVKGRVSTRAGSRQSPGPTTSARKDRGCCTRSPRQRQRNYIRIAKEAGVGVGTVQRIISASTS